jgi:hypothetical protein
MIHKYRDKKVVGVLCVFVRPSPPSFYQLGGTGRVTNELEIGSKQDWGSLTRDPQATTTSATAAATTPTAPRCACCASTRHTQRVDKIEFIRR